MTLPNNLFGLCVMLLVLCLIAVVPFVLVLWIVGLIAPWWVATPCAIAASVIVFCKTVTWKGK